MQTLDKRNTIVVVLWNQNLEIVEGKVIIYQTKDGASSIDVRLEGETVWLSANQMAVLFGRDEKTIRKHINNAIQEELRDNVVVAKFATTTKHGAIKDKVQVHYINVYNLDVIISVGYRIKSQRGFSNKNLWRMKQFYENYSLYDTKLSPLVREINWTNNMIILSRTKSIEEKDDEVVEYALNRSLSPTMVAALDKKNTIVVVLQYRNRGK